jgi:hypothetical protein
MDHLFRGLLVKKQRERLARAFSFSTPTPPSPLTNNDVMWDDGWTVCGVVGLLRSISINVNVCKSDLRFLIQSQ